MIFDPDKKVLTYDEAEEKASSLRKRGEKIIMMSGTFDLPHISHAGFFYNAKKNGGKLFIALGTDEHITALKGPSRPVMPQDIRASTLAAFSIVDYVVIADEPLQMPSKIHFEILLSKIKPDIFALNDDDSAIELKRGLCAKYGVELVIVPRFLLAFENKDPENYVSTTNIIKRVKAKDDLTKPK